MLRFSIFVATGLLVGCPSKQPQAPRAATDTALRIRIAQAEARRVGGIEELLEIARTNDVHARELALRGLGRVGGLAARAALEQALADGDARIVSAAASAIGVLASLDEDATWNPTAKLVAALPRAALPVLESLGRAGDATSQAWLAARTADSDPAVASTAALALGRHGRRKLAWSAVARTALARATRDADSRVRYAATYALSREHEPPSDNEVTAALTVRIADPSGETRAMAIAGLAKRKAVRAARKQIEAALGDRDWRVSVEAVRALSGDSGDEPSRIAVIDALPEIRDAQPIIEALRILLDHPVTDRAALERLAKRAPAVGSDLAKAWIACLSDASNCSLPDHLRFPLAVDAAKTSSVSAQRALMRQLVAHVDPRVHAAGLGLVTALWKEDASQRQSLVDDLLSALANDNPIVAGTAVDVSGELYELMAASEPLRAPLDVALVARAHRETDVELASSLYALVGKQKLAGGADACRVGLTAAPARAKAAAECLRAFGENVPAAVAAATALPPVDVTTVIGKHLVWHLATTRGAIEIALLPDVAPWAVASIVALTRRGFYDGLEFHRVVPDFVVQGGDPTQSGWGGPGYTLPAEPASSADGPGYIAGGVGMADAGRDSAGSQWFIMHARAPHLDGRYTWVGHVTAGQTVADSLLIGDRVVRATIEGR